MIVLFVTGYLTLIKTNNQLQLRQHNSFIKLNYQICNSNNDIPIIIKTKLNGHVQTHKANRNINSLTDSPKNLSDSTQSR